MFLLFLCTAEAGEFTLSFLLFSFLSCFFFFFFSFPEGATVALPALLGSRAPVSLGGGGCAGVSEGNSTHVWCPSV